MSETAEVLMLSSPSQALDGLEISHDLTEERPGSKERSSSDDEAEPITSKARKWTTKFSDSESDLDKENEGVQGGVTSPSKSEDISDNDSDLFNNKNRKSRIKHFDTSESDDSPVEERKAPKKSARTENKVKKLKDKFKRLVSNQINSQEKETPVDMKSNSDSEGSEKSDEEVSCLKIKQVCKYYLYPSYEVLWYVNR